MYPIIVVGAGAAGYFAAIKIADQNPDREVLILEKSKDVLQKVSISGGGRCTLTHGCWSAQDLIKYYPRGSKELLGPFHRFACADTMEWFEDRGVKLKIEDDGRVFPQSDDSATIVECLKDEAKRLGVRVLTQQRLDKIVYQNGIFHMQAKDSFETDRLVITTGSSPAIWNMLFELGLQIAEPVPSLFTFNIKDSRLRDLSGISVPQVHVTIPEFKKSLAEGPVLVTHWGLSGPGILKLSSYFAPELYAKSYDFNIKVNWAASTGNKEQVMEALQVYKSQNPKKQISAHQLFQLPSRLWKRLLEFVQIPETLIWADVNKKQLTDFCNELTESTFHVKGKSTHKEEFVTSGGVLLNEINFSTFESKKIPGLYLAGEVLNIDALTGGFNFQAAWTGAWIIGESIV
jgi:predicted Rossmann fold flavoprotein